MKASTLIFIALAIIFFTFFKNNDMGPQEMLKNLSDNGMERETEHIKYMFNYTDLYKNEPTVDNVIGNVIHPIIYTIVIEMNTIIPLTAYVMSGEYATLIMKIIAVLIAIYLLIIIPTIIKAGITLYFFFKEKKKTKMKIYQ